MKNNSTLLILFLLSFVSFSAFGQNVSGKITDENNAALPGAAILVSDTGTGEFSDIDGNFNLTLDPGEHVLEFSFIGYKKQVKTITAPNKGAILVNVQLQPDAVFIDDVVVVGYGVQREKEVTGNI